ncbi:MAG: ATP-binding protein [Acidimicrobiales bacterium]
MGLGARLALVFAGVAAATALIVGSASYVTTDRQVTSEVDQFLKQRVNEITEGEREQPRDRRDGKGDDGKGDDEVINAVGSDAEVQVLDREGIVVSNSGLLLPVDAVDVELADENGRQVVRTVSIDGTEYRMITEHLNGGGALQVARSLDESAGLVSGLQSRLVGVAGVIALLAAGAGWIVAQRTTRPLRALTDAVDEVAETRDFSVPVPATGSDEVGRLARGFNRMLAALQLSQEQQQRLVQDAAHELRTPLTSMTANVEWLMRAPDVDPETRQETLAGVRRELGELNDVMSEIIELATDTREPPSPVPTELASVADGVVARFVRRSGREVNVDATPVTVQGDADSLARAITNLLNNAHKYSPEGSPIALTVGPSGVFVDDAGPGIPAAERDVVFDRFYRRAEDRSMPGSGLGLSIVAGIVEQHGGTVMVADSPLGGARVGFSLPAR